MGLMTISRQSLGITTAIAGPIEAADQCADVLGTRLMPCGLIRCEDLEHRAVVAAKHFQHVHRRALAKGELARLGRDTAGPGLEQRGDVIACAPKRWRTDA